MPVREIRGYREKSLLALKEEVAQAAGSIRDEADHRLVRAYSAKPTETTLYDRLCSLAQMVERGDAAANMPIYSGGLFLTDSDSDDRTPEAEAARFLSRYKVPDQYLATALDRLARDEDQKRHDLVSIDYKSLGVRQLGSIYEGLLEFRLRIAPERMAIVKGAKDKGEKVVPYREATKQNLKILKDGRGGDAKERMLPKGAVYIENDRHERKASGSYYTPDHVVSYIVEHAVGPVLRDHLDRLRPKLREAQQAYRQAQQRQAGFQKKGMVGDNPEKVANDPKWQAVVDDLFELRVLDPAMGSGHFLVEAVDFITDRMLDFLNAFPWNPVQSQLNQTRETILAELERQGVTIDPGKLTDVNLLKRQVLKRCIYGVDLNPMAVELAKVSLWLDCFTLGAPLSFLDHHLKSGNSLIGVSIEQARAAIEFGEGEQLGLFASSQFAGVMLATDLMRRVGALSDVTAEQLRTSRDEFDRANEQLAPFKRVLDVYTSRWFGNRPRKVGRGATAQVIDPTVEFLRSSSSESWLHGSTRQADLSPEEQDVAEIARLDARRHRLLHWELEFPEVFFAPRAGTTQVVEQRPDPGFDAVIGNPPWIRQESIGSQKLALAALLSDVYDSVADTYVYFVGRGLDLLRRDGRLGMVLPNKWLRADYGEKMRAWLTRRHQPLELVDFGHSPLFPDADTFPCVFLASAKRAGSSEEIRYCAIPREEQKGVVLDDFVASRAYLVPSIWLRPEGWTLESPDASRLMTKIRADHPHLAADDRAAIYRGIIPGLTEALFIDQETRDRLVAKDPSCERILRKVLRGRNIQRWQSIWDGEWIILLKSSENATWPWAKLGDSAEQVFRRTYPSLHAHMKPLQEALERRQDKGKYWWELRSCSYYEELERPKVMYQEILFHSWFAWDTEGYLHNNKAYTLRTDHRYITGVLNSSLIWWYLWRTIPHMKDEAFAMQSFAVERLPVPEPTDSQRATLDDLVERAVALAAESQLRQQRFSSVLGSDLGVERPSQKLEQFWRLNVAGLEKELRRAAGRGLVSVQTALADRYRDHVREYRELWRESLDLELKVQRLVFDLYGLTDEEVSLLRQTAPPRDPLTIVEDDLRLLSHLA